MSNQTPMTLYDHIGVGYSRRRIPDPRIAEQIHSALKGSNVVANVGAGTGSYEPAHCTVIAVEPSLKMIEQRPPGPQMVLQAVAEAIPLRSRSVDAAMAILTIHHWNNWRFGLRELRRISSGRVVIFTWDPAQAGFWLTDRYFPDILEKDRLIFPSIEQISQELRSPEVTEVTIPHDCTDGFLGAYWRRPESYLDPETRSAISAFAGLPGLEDGVTLLESELQDGTWSSMFGHLRSRQEFDLGYRLISGYAH
jgi:SAM-dependent methyltransferase